MTKVAVVGLGRFGMALAQQLVGSRVEVIAVDTDAELIDEVKDLVDVAVELDSTDERALRSQDIDKVDTLVVAIGENFEAALLTAVIAKQMGIPNIICRASTHYHAQIFRQIGANEVIQPETDAGQQLARKLANPFLEDFVDLGEGFTLIELLAPSSFRGKTIRELNLRAKYSVNLVAIRRPTGQINEKSGEMERKIIGVPQPDEVIRPQDVLIVIGATGELARLPKE